MRTRSEEKLPLATWVAIGVLALALLSAAYYFAIQRPVSRGIREADAERIGMEERLSVLEQQAANVAGASEEVERFRASGRRDWMPSYSNLEAELAMLNRLLPSRTSTYNMSFGAPERTGNQIRRPLSLSFTAYSYQEAKDILYQLLHGETRCLIFNVNLSGIDANLNGKVQVNLSAKFYETMIGGTPDLELSDRSAAVDPAVKGISGIPSGVSSNIEVMKEYLTRGSDYSGLDSVTRRAGGDG